MKNRIKYLILLSALAPLLAWAQQDPQYSLYMFDKMALNPAAAGSKDAMELNILARDQWVGINGAPMTDAVLLSSPVASKKVGWGVELMDDKIGPTNNVAVQGNYAYNIPIGSGKLAAGLGIGVSQYSIDWSQIDMKDKTDVYSTLVRSSKVVPNANAGLYYHTQTWYAGLSFNHLVESRFTDIVTDSAAAFKPHMYFILGKAFRSKSGIIWNPSIILQSAQNAPGASSLNLNVLLAEKLWLGVSFKFNYGMVFLASYKVSQVMSIGYAYDLGLNNIGKVGGGTHELALTFDFAKYKAAQVSPRYF